MTDGSAAAFLKQELQSATRSENLTQRRKGKTEKGIAAKRHKKRKKADLKFGNPNFPAALWID
jgi:hypothetical protein